MLWIILDVIQGHAPGTKGEDYGEVLPDVMYPEILKYPEYRIVAGERRDKRRRGQRQVRRIVAELQLSPTWMSSSPPEPTRSFRVAFTSPSQAATASSSIAES